MAIVITLDVVLAKKKLKSKILAERIGISEQNLSLLKSGKVKGVRFSTLEKLCAVLECQPGDLLKYDTAVTPEQNTDKNHSGVDTGK